MNTSLPTLYPGFSTDNMNLVFTPDARVSAMVRFEAALATASAEAGFFPTSLAAEIDAACRSGINDAESVLAEGWESGSPVIALLERLREGLSPEAADVLHRGATTQDVVDTATILMIKDGLSVLEGSLATNAGLLIDLVMAHRTTPMMGRTLLQASGPTTFGLSASNWLHALSRHLSSLPETARELPLQLGGPTGTLSEFGDRGRQVTIDMAALLGLEAPIIPWHTDRSIIAEIGAVLSRLSMTNAKIGVDLALLSATGVEEIRMRPGRSSSIPGKRNPIDAVRSVAAAEACQSVSSILMASRPHELQRAIGSWHVEWFAVPIVFQTAAASTEAIGDALRSIEVDIERMASNLGPVPDSEFVSTASALVDGAITECRQIIEEPPA